MVKNLGLTHTLLAHRIADVRTIHKFRTNLSEVAKISGFAQVTSVFETQIVSHSLQNPFYSAEKQRVM